MSGVKRVRQQGHPALLAQLVGKLITG